MILMGGHGVKRLISMFGFACLAWAAGPDLDRANKLYNITEFQQSLEVLQAVPNKDAVVYELMGRNYYGLGDFRKATDALERSAALAPGNSTVYLWLGRAYGRRAETSSIITAPGPANKARQVFLGGGFDRAAATAAQIARISPSEGYWAQARLAEKRKEFGTAEAQLRRALEIAPQQVGRLIDLARLLTRRGRYQEADLSLAKAERIAPNSPRLMFAKADLYIKGKRNLDVARELLKRYLNSTLTPEDPPRADAEKLLKQVQGS